MHVVKNRAADLCWFHSSRESRGLVWCVNTSTLSYCSDYMHKLRKDIWKEINVYKDNANRNQLMHSYWYHIIISYPFISQPGDQCEDFGIKELHRTLPFVNVASTLHKLGPDLWHDWQNLIARAVMWEETDPYKQWRIRRKHRQWKISSKF